METNKKCADMDLNNRMDDLNSGYLLERGINLFCNGPKPDNVDIIMSCGVQLFTGESFHDGHGGNRAAPVSMTIHPLNVDTRAQYKNWANLGFVPNLMLGRETTPTITTTSV